MKPSDPLRTQSLLTAMANGHSPKLAAHELSPEAIQAQLQTEWAEIQAKLAKLTAEVALENKDIGFVKVGQQAEVKLETFPFTRYGTVPATVTRISADAVPDEKRGALFMATLKLDKSAMTVEGKSIRLSPGMNLTAEVKTGKRRAISYLLNPIQQHADEAAKER